MLYNSSQEWRSAPRKQIMLFGMSGLGKTHLSNILRASGNWFHYSVDYRIGTRYMGEHIVDNFKAEAMNNPFLEQLLRSDSIYIASNITFDNLSPLSTYLGKPGNREKGGISFDEYVRRQRLHRDAEINAMLDSAHFINRAEKLYGYQNFVCDTSGSIVEVVDADDPNDRVMQAVSQNLLPVLLEGNEEHTNILVERFNNDPKPMYYNEPFLLETWSNYLAEHNIAPEKVDPDHFIRWGYRKLLISRKDRYKKIAQQWGISISASKLTNVTDEYSFNELIAETLHTK